MTGRLETNVSQAHEGGLGDRNSSFDQYTGRGSIEEKHLIRKQDWRIVPLCSMIYLFSFLDRTNIGITHFCILAVFTLLLLSVRDLQAHWLQVMPKS